MTYSIRGEGRSYTLKAVRSALNLRPHADKKYVCMIDGKVLVGEACTSKTYNGVRYNRLMRLSRKLRGAQ